MPSKFSHTTKSNAPRIKLEKKVNKIFNEAANDLKTLERPLDDIFGSKHIEQLIDWVLSDKDWLEAIASDSYVHGNGFDKIVLFSLQDPPYKVRLHIWWPDLISEENIHDHRWDFCSTVISGLLRFEQYEVVQDGSPINEYKYIDKGSSYELEPIGPTFLKCVFTGTAQAKSHYFLSYEVPHRIYAERGTLTSTIILQAPAVRKWTRLFTNRVYLKPETIEPESFSPKMLESRLKRYLKSIT